ncbi:MAG TPA: sirohydrochlorin cobaltochelatase [Patescibacteria group bacterium]|nr:sirohydrochlorin cobaltochelatase [Patescibacteria group bacterium]
MKMLKLLSVCIALVICSGMGYSGSKVQAAEAPQDKKAILVVSFGTTYADARKANIESVANKISKTFPGYDVRMAFTSRIILKKIADRDGIKIDTEKQALNRLKAEGYSEVIVQPLHMIPGEEYDKVNSLVAQYAHDKAFAKIELGRPIFDYTGQEEKPDDYQIAIDALKTQLPKLANKEAVVFMGHGGVHPANTAYAALQLRFQDAKLKNVFVFAVDGEGYPTLDSVVEKLKEQKINKVTLMPLMLVAGDHATNDMAGDEKDSAKSVLLQAGFKVETYLHGLGENGAIQDIYVQHVKDAMEGKYNRHERGKDRPEIPVID